MKILITGGAGFVGAHLARSFLQQNPDTQICVIDNLRRRGSELNLPDFKRLGVRFFHGDIRIPSDLNDLEGNFDLMIEASAEPSVLAGLNSSPRYVLDTNLTGTLNCLEFARHRTGGFLFLSTSRVYSIAPLKKIKLIETPDRFEIDPKQEIAGVSTNGVTENFSVNQARSLYGATKLASEVLAQEYSDTYKLPVLINRCGVIAGPGQFGKVDQGVFTLWVIHHVLGKPLKYTGFGGEGKQVRDLLHPGDLFDLIQKQINGIHEWNADVYNVGGGREISLSMKELTLLCQKATQKQVPIEKVLQTPDVDVPLYVTDAGKAEQKFNWKPRISPDKLIAEVAQWVVNNRKEIESLL